MPITSDPRSKADLPVEQDDLLPVGLPDTESPSTTRGSQVGSADASRQLRERRGSSTKMEPDGGTVGTPATLLNQTQAAEPTSAHPQAKEHRGEALQNRGQDAPAVTARDGLPRHKATEQATPDQHGVFSSGQDAMDGVPITAPVPTQTSTIFAAAALDNAIGTNGSVSIPAPSRTEGLPPAQGSSSPVAQLPDQPGASAQLGESLLRLATKADGSSKMELMLHPADLGSVRIRLDRNKDGLVRVSIAASEPSTLQSLIMDRSHLHAALNAAAVPEQGRHLDFSLIPALGSGDSRSEGSAASATGSDGSAMGGSAAGGDGRTNGGTPRETSSGRLATSAPEEEAAGEYVVATRFRYNGINITA